MWLYLLLICTSPTDCHSDWSQKFLFETEEICLDYAAPHLKSGISFYEDKGKSIVYADGRCVKFDFVMKKGDPT